MKKWLIIVFLISILFRVFGIKNSPPEMFGDELDVGYHAFSLLKTGRDYYSNPFPLYIHSFSEWRLPLLMYFSVLPISIFGLNEFGVRSTSVILGILLPIVVMIYLSTINVKKKMIIGAGIVCAILPWQIHYSRVGFEVILQSILILLGILFYTKKSYITSALLFGLSLYVYSTSVIFIFLYLIIDHVRQRKIPNLKFTIIFILLAIPFAFFVYSGTATQRFSRLNIIGSEEQLRDVSMSRTESKSPFERAFSNKYAWIIDRFVSNYLTTFSTTFLFTRGDPDLRHGIGTMGNIYMSMSVLLIIGLVYCVNKKHYGVLIFIAIAPVASSLTLDGGYHSTRTFLMSIPVAIMSGIGLAIIYQKTKKIFTIIAIVIAIEIASYANYYYFTYPSRSWQWWQTGFKQIYSQAKDISGNYKKVIFNNTYELALPRFLFYFEYSPSEFQKSFKVDKPMDNVLPNYDGFSLNNRYYFGSFRRKDLSISTESILEPGNLYVLSIRDDLFPWENWEKNKPESITIHSRAYSPKGDPILYVVSKN